MSHGFKLSFDGVTGEVDKLFEERRKRLKRLSSPQFTKLRKKFHYETLATYLHSMKEFNEEMKSLHGQIIG